MYLFKSKLHQIYTQEYKKVTLNYLDAKRYIKENNIDTLAWGHRDIAYYIKLKVKKKYIFFCYANILHFIFLK